MMPKNSPMPTQELTPEQINQAVKTTLQILDPTVAWNLTEILRTKANLDLNTITSLRQVAMFEAMSRVIFREGAGILVRRLHFEFQKPLAIKSYPMKRTLNQYLAIRNIGYGSG